MSKYKKEDLEFLRDKIQTEGFDYALREYSDWPEFHGTELGEAISVYNVASQELEDIIEDLFIENEIDSDFLEF